MIDLFGVWVLILLVHFPTVNSIVFVSHFADVFSIVLYVHPIPFVPFREAFPCSPVSLHTNAPIHARICPSEPIHVPPCLPSSNMYYIWEISRPYMTWPFSLSSSPIRVIPSLISVFPRAHIHNCNDSHPCMSIITTHPCPPVHPPTYMYFDISPVQTWSFGII